MEYLLRRHLPRGYTVARRLEHKNMESDKLVLNTREERVVVAEVKWSAARSRHDVRSVGEAVPHSP